MQPERLKIYFMSGNILSYALTGYAIYSALKNKSTLAEQLDRIVDIEKNQDSLSSEVDKLLTTTYTLLDESLKVDYTFIVGRPTNMNRLSGSIHFMIRNTSDKNTYLAKAIMFTPILGTVIGNLSTQRLFALGFSTGVRIEPGAEYSGRIAFNNLELSKDIVKTVNDKLLEKFHKAEGWDKLGDRYATIQGGCEADVWLMANAPYVDSAHDYVVSRREVKGDLMWHGGNYLPGNTTPKDGLLGFGVVKQMFNL